MPDVTTHTPTGKESYLTSVADWDFSPLPKSENFMLALDSFSFLVWSCFQVGVTLIYAGAEPLLSCFSLCVSEWDLSSFYSRHDQGRGRTLTRLVSFIGHHISRSSFERNLVYNKDHQPGRRFAYVFAKEQRLEKSYSWGLVLLVRKWGLLLNQFGLKTDITELAFFFFSSIFYI